MGGGKNLLWTFPVPGLQCTEAAAGAWHARAGEEGEQYGGDEEHKKTNCGSKFMKKMCRKHQLVPREEAIFTFPGVVFNSV